jgi:hypothetical protein
MIQKCKLKENFEVRISTQPTSDDSQKLLGRWEANFTLGVPEMIR